MPLPALDSRGLLPPGVHQGSLAEIEQAFCTSLARQDLWRKAREFLEVSLLPLLDGQSLILAGSFFSDKEQPGDIEATVVIDTFHQSIIPIMRLFAARETIHRDYGVDCYPTFRVPGHNDFVQFFQYVGPKAAASKNLNPFDLRGVVKVTL